MTKFVDIYAKPDTIQEDVRNIVHGFIPEWPIERIQIKELEGGFVNAMYKCWLQPEVNEKLDDQKSNSVNDSLELIVRAFSFKMDHVKLGDRLKNIFINNEKSNVEEDQNCGNKSTPPVDINGNELDSNKTETEVANTGSEDTSDQKGNDMKNIDFNMIMFNRVYEVLVFEKVSAEGLGGKFYGTFQNGLCYEFVKGTTLDSDIMAKPEFVQEFATKLAHFHTIQMAKPEHLPFKTMHDKMKATMMPLFQVIGPMIQMEMDKCTEYDYSDYPKIAWMMEESLRIEDIAMKIGMNEIGFCHNDLNPSNGIWDEHTKTFKFIDFEMTMDNYINHDIALHFASCCGHLLYKFDADRLPSNDFRLNWLRIYFKERNRRLNLTRSAEEFEDEVWQYHRSTSAVLLLMCLRFAMVSPMFHFKPDLFMKEGYEFKHDHETFYKSGKEAARAYFENKDELLKVANTEKRPENVK